ncbi:hypothetical protein MKEN_01275800 [Mycena kentingensis (nom. inval.)]|nr:hypothetical protein MKEN_01275800 [Mycena kentingensis (nom. inval.)]
MASLLRSSKSNATTVSIPAYLCNRVQRKAVVKALQQRETTRALVRTLYMHGAEPPDEIPRPIYEFYAAIASCENKDKNRYVDVVAYDTTRVSVDGRYLNANWLLERFGHKFWIGAQAPLPNTAHAFLSRIRTPISLPGLSDAPPTRIRTIVQLTKLVEAGRRKAHSYFPSHAGQSVVHVPEEGCSGPPIVATLLESVAIPDACCVRSIVSIVLEGEPPESAVTFTHLLFTAWPDHGVPELGEQTALMAFVHLVDRTNRQDSDDPDPPMIIGCSAGIGRTGTFIAISSLLRAHGMLPPPAYPSTLTLTSPLGPLAFDEDHVAQEVDSLREQRPGMVQQQSQLELIYAMLESALRRA